MEHKQLIERLKALQPLESGLFYFSIVACLFIGPFTIYRFIQGHWVQAAVDAFVLLLAGYCMVEIYRKGTNDLLHLIVSVSLAIDVALVTAANGVDSIYWMYPTIAISFFLVPLRSALVVTGCLIATISWLIFDNNNLPLTATIIITMLVTYSCTFFIFKSYREIETKLKRQVYLDALTGAGNRLAFDKEIEKAMELSQQGKRNTSLLFFDLDDFKSINDNFGHSVGDRVLVDTVHLINDAMKASDGLFRYGGEEFAVLLAATDITNAVVVAEKVRHSIANHNFGIERDVTISIGVAQCRTTESVNGWIKAADALLYQSKSKGKNTVSSRLSY